MIEQLYSKLLRYLIDVDSQVATTYSKKVYASNLDYSYFWQYNAKTGEFHDTPYSLIFDLCQKYWTIYGTMPTDSIVSAEVAARSDLPDYIKTEVSKTINEIRQFDANANEFDFVVKQVQEEYIRNQSLQAMHSAVQRLPNNPEKAVDFLQKEIIRIKQSAEVNEDPSSQSQPVWQFMSHQYDVYTSSESGFEEGYIPYGFHSWDVTFGGMVPGELVVISAGPNVGKSFVAHEIGYHAAFELGLKVVIVEREMLPTPVALRLLSRQSGVPSRKIRRKKSLTPEESARLEESWAELRNNKYSNLLIIPPDRSINTEMIKREIEAYFGDEKPDLIVIDYLDEIEPLRQYRDQWQGIVEITTHLRRMATHFRCPVLTMTQNNSKGINNPDAGLTEVANKTITRKAGTVIMLTESIEHKYQPPGIGEYVGTPGVLVAKFVKSRDEAKDLVFYLQVEFATSLIQDYDGLSTDIGRSLE